MEFTARIDKKQTVTEMIQQASYAVQDFERRFPKYEPRFSTMADAGTHWIAVYNAKMRIEECAKI